MAKLNLSLLVVFLTIVSVLSAFSDDSVAFQNAVPSGENKNTSIEFVSISSEPLSPEVRNAVSNRAEKTIADAERWLGLDIFGPNKKRLRIEFDSQSSDFGSICYRLDSASVSANFAATSDAIAHETGHAIIHKLKPGWKAGAALIMHEAVADIMVVLSQLSNPAIVRNILASQGGLDIENKASRFVELPDGTALRSALAPTTLMDVPFQRDTLHLPEIAFRGSRNDPHRASVVITAAIYDFVRFRSHHLTGSGPSRPEVIQQIADEAGRMVLAAALISEEHQVTIESYMMSLLLIAKNHLGTEARDGLAELLVGRGLISSQSQVRPEFSRPAIGFKIKYSAGFDDNAFLSRIADFDNSLLDNLRNIPLENPETRDTHPLPYYKREYPHTPCIFKPKVHEVISDRIDLLGGTFIRVKYSYLPSRPAGTRGVDRTPASVPADLAKPAEAFACYLFNKAGQLTICHTDRPLQLESIY
jgi:hypothetical protein